VPPTPPTLRLACLSFLAIIAISPVIARQEGARPVSEIADLIDAAEPGATVTVPPGLYSGHLVIRKPIVLDGAGRATIDGGGKGTVVQIVSPGVTIRGLTIRGSGKSVTGEPAGVLAVAGPVVIEDNIFEDVLFGIDLRESPDSIVRRNVVRGKDLEPGRRGDGIRLWWSHNCLIDRNRVYGMRDVVLWYTEGLTISRNRVEGSRYGLHFMYSHDTLLLENELERNSVGVYLMYSNGLRLIRNSMVNNRGSSGYGIGLKDCDDIVIQDNALLANRVGAYLDNSPSSIDSTGLFEGNLIAFNEIGVLATPNTHDNVFTANSFIENEEQAAVHGRGALASNTFSKEDVGNFWSDYAGFDQDGDGIGDLEYAPRSLFSSMLAREPNLRLFVHSPAQQAVEFTARALPELRPAPLLTDPAPLSSAPPNNLAMAERAGSAAWPMALLGAGLLVASGAVLWVAGRPQSWIPGPKSSLSRSGSVA